MFFVGSENLHVLTLQKTLRDTLSGTEYVFTGQYCKCGPNWCPKFPIFGKHELSVVLSPNTVTQYVVVKVRK